MAALVLRTTDDDARPTHDDMNWGRGDVDVAVAGVLMLRGSTHVIQRSSRKATVVEAHVDEDGGGPAAKFTH